MKDTRIAVPGKRPRLFAFHLEQLLVPDWFVVGALILLGLLTRLPFQSNILYHWDSVNFAYAIHEFNLVKEQPHPPGYIGYVWLTRLVDSVIQDGPATLVAISVAASTLAVVALFYLGRSMFDRRVGLIAALFLAASPLFWFYSEIALPHTLDALLVIASVGLLYKTMKSDARYVYPAVALLAVAGGVRQQTLIFLAPLLLFALRQVGWKRFFTAGVLGAAICLAWFIPLITLSGGLSEYLRIMGQFSGRFQDTTSVMMGAGWEGVVYNLRKLLPYTVYGLSAAVIPVIVYLFRSPRKHEWVRQREKAVFLVLWIAPALFFYTFIHMGQQGLIFVFLPALMLLSALALVRLLANRPYWPEAAVAGIILVNAAIFLLAPEYPFGPDRQRLLTRATLANSDLYYQERFQAIQENFAPESTAILAVHWHHVAYYLPGYTALPYSGGSEDQPGPEPEAGSGELQLFTLSDLNLQVDAAGYAAIVTFEPELGELNETPALSTYLPLGSGDRLTYLELGPEDKLYFTQNSFGILRK